LLPPMTACGTLVNNAPIYSKSYLGIDKYEEQRKRVGLQFGQMRDKFLERLNEFVNKEDGKSMVFTEDLKNVLYLVDKKPNEIELLKKMIKQFNSQNSQNLRFGTYVFGPIIMRMVSYLDDPDLALELLHDPELSGMFDQLSSYVTVMTLLFNHERYQDVMALFKEFQDKEIGEYRYPRDLLSLYIAACYKINTPESYQKAIEAMSGARETGSAVLRKAVAIFAKLAFNHGHYDVALEALSLPKGSSIAIRNIRAMALAKIGRIEDAIAQLKFLLNQEVAYKPAATGVVRETISCLQSAIEENGSQELKIDFEKVMQALKDGNHISNESIDAHLLAPVEVRFSDNLRQQRTRGPNDRIGFQGDSRYNSNSNRHYRDGNQRNDLRMHGNGSRGLMEME